MTSAIGVTSKIKLTEETIRDALYILMKRHALLSMCIRRNSDNMLHFYEMEVESVDLTVREDCSWEKVVEETRGFDQFDTAYGPLWRVIFMPNAKLEANTADCAVENETNSEADDELENTEFAHNSVVVFVQDHAINDGVGTVTLNKDFIFILNELLNGREIDAARPPPMPPQEYYINKNKRANIMIHFIKMLHLTLASFIPFAKIGMFVTNYSMLSNCFVKYCGLEKQRNREAKKTTRVQLRYLNLDETQMLVEKCKENECTVQGVIQAACNLALTKMMCDGGAKLPLTFFTGVPMDSRKRIIDGSYTNDCSEYGGFLFILHYTKHDKAMNMNVESFWNVARYSSKQVHYEITRYWKWLHHTGDFLTLMLDQGYALEKYWNYGRGFSPIVASTIGKFTFMGYQDDMLIKPSGIMFSVAGHTSGPIFGTYAITIDGKMSISSTYYPHVTSDAKAREFADLVVNYIRNVINESYKECEEN